MGQNFIADTVNQTLLFPPSLHDWLPEGHLARFLLDVVSALDLSAIYTSYQEKDAVILSPLEHLVCVHTGGLRRTRHAHPWLKRQLNDLPLFRHTTMHTRRSPRT